MQSYYTSLQFVFYCVTFVVFYFVSLFFFLFCFPFILMAKKAKGRPQVWSTHLYVTSHLGQQGSNISPHQVSNFDKWLGFLDWFSGRCLRACVCMRARAFILREMTKLSGIFFFFKKSMCFLHCWCLQDGKSLNFLIPRTCSCAVLFCCLVCRHHQHSIYNFLTIHKENTRSEKDQY